MKASVVDTAFTGRNGRRRIPWGVDNSHLLDKRLKKAGLPDGQNATSTGRSSSAVHAE
jgi:hypothetical protein